MLYTFHSEQWLPYPLETVFSFFSDPANLPRLMPPWQHAAIDASTLVAPPNAASSFLTRGAAGAGSRITLSFRPFPLSPIRIRWEAEIAEFSLYDSFCDRQVRGPFHFWNHCHRFRALDRGGIDVTLVTGQVEYEPPLGPMGWLVNRAFLRRQLARTFAYRKEKTMELLEQYAAQLRSGQRQAS